MVFVLPCAFFCEMFKQDGLGFCCCGAKVRITLCHHLCIYIWHRTFCLSLAKYVVAEVYVVLVCCLFPGLALLSSGEESRLQGLTTDLWAVSKGQKDLQLIRPVGAVPCQVSFFFVFFSPLLPSLV